MLPVAGDLRRSIVDVLSSHPSLRAREVHASMRDEFGRSVSYQGVHKVLLQLLREGVVEKAGARYSLSSEWVKGLKEFSKKLSPTGRLPSLLEIPANSTREVLFQGKIIDPFYWLLYESEKLVSKKGGKPVVIYQQNGIWPVTVLSDEGYARLVSLFRQSKGFLLLKDRLANRVWDSFFTPLWVRNGVRVTHAKDVAEGADVIVVYDYIVQVYQPKDVKLVYDKLARQFVKNLGSGLSSAYKVIFEQPAEIKVVVTRNQALADSIKREAVTKFKK